MTPSTVREALAIIDARGVEALSLREVARRLHVSHQAPYKHFASRDHLLAEIVRRAFEAFGNHLDTRLTDTGGGTAETDLVAMGHAYLDYARTYPLQYRLMFGTPLPDPSRHPAMMASAQHAFALLRDGLRRMHAEADRAIPEDVVQRDALFVWATLHGLASIGRTPALETLRLSALVLAGAESHVLARIGDALAATPVSQRLPAPAGRQSGEPTPRAARARRRPRGSHDA